MLKKRFVKDRCVTCKQCMVACAVRHSASRDVYLAALEVPRSSYRLQITLKKEKPWAIICQNCARPKCMEACKYGAITKYEDGNVVIDQATCTGCWACVEACPFGAIVMNTEIKVAINCDDCRGYDDMACVTACKTAALVYSGPGGASE